MRRDATLFRFSFFHLPFSHSFSFFALRSRFPSSFLSLSLFLSLFLAASRARTPSDRSTSFKNDPLKPVRITPARWPISRSYFFLSSPLRRSFPGADARTSLHLPSSSPMLVFHGVNKARPGSSCHVIITGERAYLGLSFSLFFFSLSFLPSSWPPPVCLSGTVKIL